jgi:hypothetical protein
VRAPLRGLSALRAAWGAWWPALMGVGLVLLLTTLPWTVALALLAIVGIGAGLWILGAIASLPADEEDIR